MKYNLLTKLYTMEERVPYEYHREQSTGNSIIYKDGISLVLCEYKSNSLIDIRNQAEILEKYGEVESIDVMVNATKLDTFILEIPDVYNRVKTQLERLNYDIKVSTLGQYISFKLKSSKDLDTIISKAMFVINAEIMKKEQLISRRGMIKVFDELIEPDWYPLVIDKIRSIVIIERLKKPNNFEVESENLREITVSHVDSNRIIKYLSKITGKPIVQIGFITLVNASYDDVKNNIKVNREECANEIVYILAQKRYNIDPLLYLKCYRDIMSVDKHIDNIL